MTRFLLTRSRNLVAGLAMFASCLVCSCSCDNNSDESQAAELSKEKTEKPAIGSVIADFPFKDIRFVGRNVSDLGEQKAYVFVFTTLDCPVVLRYLPRLKQLDEEFRGQGVQFVAVNVGANDTIRESAYQAVKADIAFPFVKDFDGDAVRACGVQRTPEVVVLDANRKLCYRGRIDSQYRTGGVQPNTGREDLKEAIAAVLAGKKIEVAETPVNGCKITLREPPKPSFKVTWAEHIAPIMQKHCQECHRPGSTGPFALLTFDDAAGHADMVAEVVREERMPPVYASDEQADKINNRHVLSDEDRNLVWAWAHSGAEQGDLAKAPPAREFSDTKWLIGDPDLVVAIPKPVKVQAEGIIDYKYIFLPYKFTEDTWVSSVQILPGNGSVLHHSNLAAVPPNMNRNEAEFITGYVPGGIPMVMPQGMGFKIPKGSLLVLQSHYVTTGKEEEDLTKVGFKFCSGKVNKQIRHFRVTTGKFAIEPNSPHYPVTSSRTLKNDSTGIGMFSHMHLRGKDMVFNAHYPNGTLETLLAIPNYSFDWQIGYTWDDGKQKFPAGTKIEVVAHYDNSKFNPYNPDPTATVKEGDQTFEEMMFGFFFYTEDAEKLNITIDPKTGHAVKDDSLADAQAQADKQAK